MSFLNLVQAAQKHFPNLQVKYKENSWLMKLLGFVLFFNKSFMTEYTSTIGSTVYFPTEAFTKLRPVSSAVILLHELIHINDSNKLTKPLFAFLYACPQILVLLGIPLYFLIGWKLSLLALLFLAPLPAYFRMYFEKRAYIMSIYAINKLSQKMSFDPALEKQKETFMAHFKSSDYYFMWIFDLSKDFDDAIAKIKNNEKPFTDEVFDILDELIAAI